MERYLADVVQEGAEDAPVLMAYMVDADTPEQARQLASLKAQGRTTLADTPTPDSLHVRLFAQEEQHAQRWNDIEDPHRFKLLSPAPATVAAAYVCFHSEWSKGSALFVCQQCLQVSYPGNVSPIGDPYHKTGCALLGKGSSGCTLHIGPELVARLLATGDANGQDLPIYKAGNLTAATLRQLFPSLCTEDQTSSRTKHHLAVVSALYEKRGDKLRDVAAVVFPDDSVQTGSIWRLRSGDYGALVDGIWLLLEFPAGDDAERDRATIEQWVVKRDREGYAMLAPSF